MNKAITVVAAVSVSSIASAQSILTPTNDGVSLAGFQASNPSFFTETFDSFVTDGVNTNITPLPSGALNASGLGYNILGSGDPGDFRYRDSDFNSGSVNATLEAGVGNNTFDSLTITFSQAQTAVGMTFLSPGPSIVFGTNLSPGLEATFGGSTIELGSVLTPDISTGDRGEVSGPVFVVFESATAFTEITFSRATPTSFLTTEFFDIDDVTYLVPSPGAAMFAGAFGVAALRRRRH